jgi:uncharacterized protein YneF (UPF0154 family)
MGIIIICIIVSLLGLCIGLFINLIQTKQKLENKRIVIRELNKYITSLKI